MPVEQPEEEPKKKRRRKKSDGNDRRRLIIHVAILVVLLAFIVWGLYYFLHEGPRQGVPQTDVVQVDSDTVATE